MAPRRVLVAVDETDSSRVAARFANEFFDESDEVLAINVARRPIPWPAPVVGYGTVYAGSWASTDAYERWMRASIEGEDRTARAALAQSGVEADETMIEVGDPVEAIANAAVEHDADLIVVGATDKGLIERVIKGSVAQRLVRDAPRPVLVVH